MHAFICVANRDDARGISRRVGVKYTLIKHEVREGATNGRHSSWHCNRFRLIFYFSDAAAVVDDDDLDYRVIVLTI